MYMNVFFKLKVIINMTDGLLLEVMLLDIEYSVFYFVFKIFL